MHNFTPGYLHLRCASAWQWYPNYILNSYFFILQVLDIKPCGLTGSTVSSLLLSFVVVQLSWAASAFSTCCERSCHLTNFSVMCLQDELGVFFPGIWLSFGFWCMSVWSYKVDIGFCCDEDLFSSYTLTKVFSLLSVLKSSSQNKDKGTNLSSLGWTRVIIWFLKGSGSFWDF